MNQRITKSFLIMEEKRVNKIRITVGAAVLATLVACGTPSPSDKAIDKAKSVPSAEATTDAPAITPTLKGITKADIRLAVKVTKKDCFGSAGCNVDYKINASLAKGVAAQECDITYEVHGLEDTQTGTLNFHVDGTYEQDGYQSGGTTSSSRKLTAKVTEVDCDVVR